METVKFYGAAGTGKTSTLLNEMSNCLNAGYKPDDICYITFTKSAASDAHNRVLNKFPDFDPKSSKIRTQHSIAYRLISGGSHLEIVKPRDRLDLCKRYGLPYNAFEQFGEQDDVGSIFESGYASGNQLFSLLDKIRMKNEMVVEKNVANELSKSSIMMRAEEVLGFWDDYVGMKNSQNKFDYIDMLEIALKDKQIPEAPLLFADEFQDFGELQYQLWKMWASKCEKVFICGDDDQVLFSYSSASPKYLLNTAADREIVLPLNYRNRKKIFAFANDIIIRNKIRKIKNVTCTKDGGVINTITSSDFINMKDVFAKIDGTKRKFFLVRTNYYLKTLSDWMIDNGIPFKHLRGMSSWTPKFTSTYNALAKAGRGEKIPFSEMKDLISALPVQGTPIIKRGVKKKISDLSNESFPSDTFERWKNYYFTLGASVMPPATIARLAGVDMTDMQKKILVSAFDSRRPAPIETPNKEGEEEKFNFIGTVHSAKGLECDAAFVFNALPERVKNSIESNDTTIEDERRIMYVGLTRARDEAYLVNDFFPGGNDFFKFHQTY